MLGDSVRAQLRSSRPISLLLVAGLVAAALAIAAPPTRASGATAQVESDDSPTAGATNNFSYDASWGSAGGIGDFYSHTVHYNNGVGVATYTFVGTSATIIAGKDHDQGIATYSVDGGPAVSVSHYSATRQAQSEVFATGDLPFDVHRITVRATGTKEAAADGVIIALDAALVTGPQLQNIDDAGVSGTNKFQYTSAWGSASGVADLYQGTAHYVVNGVTTTGTFSFDGTQAAIVGVRDKDQGIATYSVDGGAPVTVDHYAAQRQAQSVLFDTGRLDAGPHTITVTATATKNAASSKTIIAIDYAAIDTTAPASSASTLVVDLGQSTGAFHGGAAGVLYGLYDQGLPSNNLIDGIKLRTVATKAQDGPQHPGADALEVVKPLADSSNGDVYIYMTDIYRGFPYQWPGSTPTERLDDYMSKIQLEVEQVLSLPAQYQDNIVFVPYNEPEGNMFGTGTWSYNNVSWLNNPTAFYAAWDQAYALIKGLMPNARIAGPNTSGLFNQDRDFLHHTVAAGTVPDVFTWHELSAPASIRSNVAKYRGWEDAEFAGTPLQGTHLPINLDEYAYNYHTSVPGQMIQWVSAIEDSKVDADIAYWNIDGNLSDSAVEANRANGQWWLLNAYGLMTGNTVKVTPPSTNNYTLQGVATLDNSTVQARALIGGGAGSYNAVFQNVPASFGTKVHAIVKEIPWTGQIGDSAAPRVIGDRDVAVINGKVTLGFGVSLPQLKESSAYEVVLTPGAADTVGQQPRGLAWAATYEAENASHTGSPYFPNGPEGSPSRVSGFYTSGGRDVGGLRTGSTLKLDFDVTAPEAGTYDLSVFASSLNTFASVQDQGPTNVFLSVDGGAEQELYLTLGYKWVVWDHTDTTVNLSAGHHTIRLAAQSIDGTRVTKGDAIVDKIDLSLPTPGNAADIYEAEYSTVNGGAMNYTVAGASGAGVVNLAAGGTSTFWVYSKNDGWSSIAFDGLSGNASLNLNGVALGTVSAQAPSTVFLSGGINRVELTAGGGGAVVDRLSVTPVDDSTHRQWLEAENATLAGSAQVSNLSLASGGKAVTGIGGGHGNASALTFAVTAPVSGTYALTIRYSNEEQIAATHYNPDIIARHADISVNGAAATRVMFPHSFHANNFWELTVPVQLLAGSNTISFRSEELPNFDGVTYASDVFPGETLRSSYAPNIDGIAVTPFTGAMVGVN